MRETLELINQMQADRVIEEYAIGEAVGATFYLPPAATLDLDVFVELPTPSGSLLVTLTPIYAYLVAHGCSLRQEHVIIGKWPVQFLSPGNRLEQEAVEEATSVDVNGVPTRVMKAEHLVAIALQTGRTKDHARILQFLEQKAVGRATLISLLEKYGLATKWQQFAKRYLDEPQ